MAAKPAPGSRPRQLRLKDRQAARASLVRVIRDYDRRAPADALVTQQFRATCASLRLLLDFDRAAEADALAARLAELEGRLAALPGAGR